jgi:hypothetical protein
MSKRETLGLSPGFMEALTTTIVEPNPVLIEYYHKAKEFEMKEMLVSKVGDGEWLYIQSNIDQNIFLLNKLEDLGLIPDSGKVCDCGIGLGTAIFDIYLQSKDLGKKYSFVGIEKQSKYVDYLNESLIGFWNDDLEIVSGDLMDQRYDEYDIVYCYTPFKDVKKLREFYLKVISEMHEGAILIENKNWGLGEGKILSSISENGHLSILESSNHYEIVPIDLDGITVFQKKSVSK